MNFLNSAAASPGWPELWQGRGVAWEAFRKMRRVKQAGEDQTWTTPLVLANDKIGRVFVAVFSVFCPIPLGSQVPDVLPPPTSEPAEENLGT